jgi:uncharacterized protein (TIGR02147 family)
MTPIWEYTDYRTWLKDWHEYVKIENPFLSYRYITARTGIDPGILSKVLGREKHFSETQLDKMITLLKLSSREEAYFRQMFLYGRSKRDEDIRIHFAKLLQMREIDINEVGAHQLVYYSKWYYPVLRNLVGLLKPTVDPESMGAALKPPITGEQVREGLKTLERIGLVRKAADGGWEPCGSFITTGPKWKSAAILEHQKHLADLGREAPDRFKPEDRDFSTLTLAIPREEFDTLRDMVQEFRQAVLKWTSSQDLCDHIVQMNLQLFPMAQISPNESYRGGLNEAS